MKECLLSTMENNICKKYSNEEEKSNIFVDNSQLFEGEMPGYLDDLLQHSKKSVFIIGNQNNNNSLPKKRIIKKEKKTKENIKMYIKSENKEKNEIDTKNKKKQKIIKKTNKKINYSYNIIKEPDKDEITQHIIHNLEISVEETLENDEEKENKLKSSLKDDKEKNEIELKLIPLYKKIFLQKLNRSLKSIFILIKMKNNMKLSVKKISNAYHYHILRNKLKYNYIMAKIMEIRKQKAEKISSLVKAYLIRREAKKLLQKTENNYIIYSLINIDKKDILYFKHIHKSGKEEKFYFEYSPLLKCFIYFINKNSDKYFTIIQGNFYNSKTKKLIDKQYEINNKGENVINLPKIFTKTETINERHDRIINRYIKLHRHVKRTTVDEFEENKKKIKDDYHLKINNSKSQKLTKLGDTSRSKSYMKIKGEPKRKSILKPSRSYVNLKCGEKKIQFGKAKIRKYKNKKD